MMPGRLILVLGLLLQQATLPTALTINPMKPRNGTNLLSAPGRGLGDVPNPYTQPAACGLTSPGHVCDPDSLLSTQGRARVEIALNIIRSNTTAPCPDGSRPGYQAAVAVVKKMSDAEIGRSGGVAASARRYAKGIGDIWGVGDSGCDNGVLLFLSISDRYAYIATGRTAMRVLTDDKATQVVENMKPLLRAEDYDEAVFKGVALIYGVFQGSPVPKPKSDWWREWGRSLVIVVSVVFAVFCLVQPWLPVKILFFLAALLLPFLWLLDKIVHMRQQARDRADREAAQKGLASLQKEMDRGEFDQTMCPICLGSLEEKAEGQGITVLDCKHCYHAACIEPWLKDKGSCPLCRTDVDRQLPSDVRKRPDEYQRRLRGYLAALEARYPRVFEHSSHRSDWYQYNAHGTWVLYDIDGRAYLPNTWAYSSMLDYRYSHAIRVANEYSANPGSGSSRGGGGSSSFGGGSFGGGGGGGGGW